MVEIAIGLERDTLDAVIAVRGELDIASFPRPTERIRETLLCNRAWPC